MINKYKSTTFIRQNSQLLNFLTFNICSNEKINQQQSCHSILNVQKREDSQMYLQ